MKMLMMNRFGLLLLILASGAVGANENLISKVRATHVPEMKARLMVASGDDQPSDVEPSDRDQPSEDA